MRDRKIRAMERRVEIFNMFHQGIDPREAMPDWGDYDDDEDLLVALETINSMKKYDPKLLEIINMVTQVTYEAGWTSFLEHGEL